MCAMDVRMIYIYVTLEDDTYCGQPEKAAEVCARIEQRIVTHLNWHSNTTYRKHMLGVRNDSHLDKMAEVESTADLVKQELNIPHKAQIHHNRKLFKLEWK